MSHDILCALIDTDQDQPRKHFDAAALGELAQSIAASGLAVPILVRPVGDRFLIVHGERRFRAVQSLGWESIPADVRDMSAQDARWLALVENVQRSDLTPIEEAQAYQAALSGGITQTELGRRLGKSQSYIAQKLRLLKLPEDVRRALSVGQLSEGHARQLLRLGSSADQSIYGEQAVRGRLSVGQLSDRVDSHLAQADDWVKLQAAESAIDAVTEDVALQIGGAVAGVRGLLPHAHFVPWLAKWGLSEVDGQYLAGCASGSERYDGRRAFSILAAMGL